MRSIRLLESTVTPDCAVTVAEARWLAEQGIADARPARTGGGFDLQARHVFGVVSHGDLQVEIVPKMPIANALKLMLYAYTGDMQHSSSAFFETDDFMLLIGQYFSVQLEKALRQGAVRGYATEQAVSRNFRGRLRISEQMARHHMQLQPLEVEFEDFTTNIPENQVLSAAARKLLHVLQRERTGGPQVSQVTRRLHRCLLQLGEVAPLLRGHPLPTWQENSINRRFVPSLRLAELILGGVGTAHTAGWQVSNGLVIETWKVFERAVARRLKDSLPCLKVETQWSAPVAADEPLRIRPDIMLSSGGRPIGVADTKYTNRNFSRNDLYQVLAYASVLQLDKATLIYAAVGADRDVAIHGSGVLIQLRHVDLGQPFEKVLDSISHISLDLAPQR